MLVKSHRDLEIYRRSFDRAIRLQKLTEGFPKEEQYSLISQARRSSRSVCANLAEGWRRRMYKGAFVNKLNEVEGEAAETQVWLEFAQAFGYIDDPQFEELWSAYEGVIGSIVAIGANADKWTKPR